MASPPTTRARSKTPLPAVPAKPSQAYGASGKANLKAQVRTSTTNFGQNFQAARQAAEVEDESEEEEEGVVADPSPAKKRAWRRGINRQPAEMGAAGGRGGRREEVAGAPGGRISDRTTTALDAGAEYDGGIGGGAAGTGLYARLKDLLVFVSALILFVTIWAWVPLPTAMHASRDNINLGLQQFFRVPPFDVRPAELEARWYRFKHDEIFSKALPDHNMPDLQWAINVNFLRRLEQAEAKIKTLQGDMSLQNETLAMLMDMLPQHIILEVINGRFVIPEPFWHALQERLGEEGDLAPLWKSYIRRNEREIEHLNQQLVSLTLDRGLQEKQIVSRETFAEALKENNDQLANQFREEFREMQRKHLNLVKEIAANTADDTVQQSPAGIYAKEQMDLLVRAYQVQTTYEQLHSVNWFSVGLGARVDPHGTSSTQQSSETSWLAHALRLVNPLYVAPNSPITALQHWHEATECWCASHSANGQAQITIHTAAKIVPRSLVVEHIPSLGTRDIKAAPHEIEIWVPTGSESKAKKIRQIMDEEHFWSSELSCGSPPWPGYICLGHGKYNIEADTNIQTISVSVDISKLGLAVNKFTIRVTENWGANYTCLYRLRMTGDEEKSKA